MITLKEKQRQRLLLIVQDGINLSVLTQNETEIFEKNQNSAALIFFHIKLLIFSENFWFGQFGLDR
jgi:hypothetical protein